MTPLWRLETEKGELSLVDPLLVLELGGFSRMQARGLESLEAGTAVRVFLGYSLENMSLVLQGEVQEARPDSQGGFLYHLRCLSSKLENPCPLMLRHVDSVAILKKIASHTGVSFLLEGLSNFAHSPLPYFVSTGTGREALEEMRKAFGFKSCLWSPLPSGKVYWGPWAFGPWPKERVVADIVLEYLPQSKKMVLPLVPRLRPGVFFQSGEGDPVFIKRVEHRAEKTFLEYGKWDYWKA